MNSSKPYLIRAMYDWIVDNELTPYIVINTTQASVQVPEEYIEDDRIVLNVSPDACRGLHITNDRIVFSARFSGVATQVFTPPSAVLAIYAKENGRGMVFGEEDKGDGEGDGDSEPPKPSRAVDEKTSQKSAKKPKLTVIK